MPRNIPVDNGTKYNIIASIIILLALFIYISLKYMHPNLDEIPSDGMRQQPSEIEHRRMS